VLRAPVKLAAARRCTFSAVSWNSSAVPAVSCTSWYLYSGFGHGTTEWCRARLVPDL